MHHPINNQLPNLNPHTPFPLALKIHPQHPLPIAHPHIRAPHAPLPLMYHNGLPPPSPRLPLLLPRNLPQRLARLTHTHRLFPRHTAAPVRPVLITSRAAEAVTRRSTRTRTIPIPKPTPTPRLPPLSPQHPTPPQNPHRQPRPPPPLPIPTPQIPDQLAASSGVGCESFAQQLRSRVADVGVVGGGEGEEGGCLDGVFLRGGGAGGRGRGRADRGEVFDGVEGEGGVVD